MSEQRKTPLNSSQKRHLLTTLTHVDKLLLEVEQIMAASQWRPAFPRYIPDIEPVRRGVIVDHLARLRRALREASGALGLDPGAPDISTLRAVHVNLVSASCALAESGSASLRGYGAVSDAAATTVDGVVGELDRLLAAIDTYVLQPGDRDLRARLDRLAETRSEVALLEELERVITRHGMVELRPLLASLVDRLEVNPFQIAVFGRVSSGKSSLLNHVLRRAVLPVGATPVTAVPVRVQHGVRERAVAQFADRPSRELPLEELATLATEAGNPGNQQHVTRLVIELPEPRLASGVAFIDTPGLGAITTAGAELALAFLPECDLGVVLVDTGGTISREDVAIARMLFEAGARCMVVLSKADLLDPAGRSRVLDYTTEALERECGFPVPVHLVSVSGELAALADTWFDGQIEPLCLDLRPVAALALRRKVTTLRDTVVATIRHRLEMAGSSQAGDREARGRAAVDRLAEAGRSAADARAACEAIVAELGGGSTEVLVAAAATLASAARDQGLEPTEVGRALDTATAAFTSRIAQRAAARVALLREQLTLALGVAAAASHGPGDPDELPRVAGLPVWEPPAAARPIAVRLPLTAILGTAMLRALLARRLRAATEEAVRASLLEHARRLAAWCGETLTTLLRAFEAQADGYRVLLDAPVGGQPPVARRAELTRDLEHLTNWRGSQRGDGDSDVARTGVAR